MSTNRLVTVALLVVAALHVDRRVAEAQHCPGGCTFIVDVAPAWSDVPQIDPSATLVLDTVSFVVTNLGTGNDTYTLACSKSGPFTCQSIIPTQVTLLGGFNLADTVLVTFTRSTSGTGWIKLTVTGTAQGSSASDVGQYNLDVGYEVPVVATVYSPRYRDVSKCFMACFDVIYQRSTVGYTAFGAPRAFTVIYNSQTDKPLPVVGVDVIHDIARLTPTAYSIQLKKSPSNAAINLLNGGTIAYYGLAANGNSRLTAAFDAQANTMGTGAHPISIIVTAYLPGSAVIADTLASVVVVNDRSASVFGRGVGVAGLQRLFFTNSRWAVTEGDGSIADYGPGGSSTPPGTFASLTFNSGTQTYTRSYPDGSFVEFNALGRMTRAADRFGLTTTINYFAAPNDSLISSITDPSGHTISPCYAAAVCGSSGSGKLSTVKVLSGVGVERVHTYTITAGGSRLIRVGDPDGLSDSVSFATNTLPVNVWDRGRNRTTFNYDSLNRIAAIKAETVTPWGGSPTRPTMDVISPDIVAWEAASLGLTLGSPKPAVRGDTVRAQLKDPLNALTLVTVDANGAPIKIVEPNVGTTTIERDQHSRPTQVTEPNGHVTTYSYTGANLTSVSDGPSGLTINLSYTSSNDLKLISGNTVETNFVYYTGSDGGPAGALNKVYVGHNTATYPQMAGTRMVTWHRPDQYGRDTAVVDSLGHTVHVTFESIWKNPWKIMDPNGNTTRLHYDTRSRPDSTYLPLRGVQAVTYGVMDEVLQGRDGIGNVTQFSYDSMLQTIRVAGPQQNILKFAYNANGATIAAHDAVDTTKADSSGYDLSGNLVRYKTRKGDAITMTYDSLGRILTRSGPGFPVDSFRYDAAGRFQVATNSASYDSLVFDQRGRLTSVRKKIGGRTYTATYSYDAMDRVYARSLNQSGSPGYTALMTFAYDAVKGTLDSLCTNGKCVTFVRALDQVVDSIVFNRGGTGQWGIKNSVNAAHALLQQAHTPAGLSGFNMTWTRDSLQRVLLRTSPAQGSLTREYAYDLDGWLKQSRDSSASSVNVVDQWLYDSAGNRIAASGTTPIYGLGNRIQSDIGAGMFTYDANGSTLCKGPSPSPCNTRQYTWDGAGRLTQVLVGGSTTVTFAYDALGRRVRKSYKAGATVWSELYIYDGDQIVLDVDSATNTVKNEYAWYPGVDNLLSVKNASFTAAALLDPNNGTVRGLAQFSGGAVIKDYGEGTWGEVAADTGVKVRFRFAGRELDQETGLYYLRARYYDPAIGRFITEDPIGLGGGSNYYTYAGNDPVNGRDPSGLGPCDEVFWRSIMGLFGWEAGSEIFDRECPDGLVLPEGSATATGEQPISPRWDPFVLAGGKQGTIYTNPAAVAKQRQTIHHDEPSQCDMASLKSAGYSLAWAIFKGTYSGSGVYATKPPIQGGRYETSGTTYGIGLMMGWDVTLMASQGSFRGVSRGVCFKGFLGGCVTQNENGFNVTPSIGFSLGIMWVNTDTRLTPITECGP